MRIIKINAYKALRKMHGIKYYFQVHYTLSDLNILLKNLKKNKTKTPIQYQRYEWKEIIQVRVDSEIEKKKKNRECQYNGQTNKIDKHLIRLVRKKRLKLLEIKKT